MSLSNFERMLLLAEEIFDVKQDPNQLDVDQSVIERLQKIHPAAVSEYDDGNGPVAWVLVIPTVDELKNKFLDGKITERELFELTEVGKEYDSIYLCSALVLKEYRRKGIVKNISLDAIKKIKSRHPIKSLFVWSFSLEGDLCAQNISEQVSLPLFKLDRK